MTTLFLLEGGKPFMKKIIPIIIGFLICCSSSQALYITASEISDDYDFLIITPENFTTELDYLKNHKENYGVKT